LDNRVRQDSLVDCMPSRLGIRVGLEVVVGMGIASRRLDMMKSVGSAWRRYDAEGKETGKT